MKNLKKLSRNNLKAVHGGDEEKVPALDMCTLGKMMNAKLMVWNVDYIGHVIGKP